MREGAARVGSPHSWRPVDPLGLNTIIGKTMTDHELFAIADRADCLIYYIEYDREDGQRMLAMVDRRRRAIKRAPTPGEIPLAG